MTVSFNMVHGDVGQSNLTRQDVANYIDYLVDHIGEEQKALYSHETRSNPYICLHGECQPLADWISILLESYGESLKRWDISIHLTIFGTKYSELTLEERPWPADITQWYNLDSETGHYMHTLIEWDGLYWDANGGGTRRSKEAYYESMVYRSDGNRDRKRLLENFIDFEEMDNISEHEGSLDYKWEWSESVRDDFYEGNVIWIDDMEVEISPYVDVSVFKTFINKLRQGDFLTETISQPINTKSGPKIKEYIESIHEGDFLWRDDWNKLEFTLQTLPMTIFEDYCDEDTGDCTKMVRDGMGSTFYFQKIPFMSHKLEDTLNEFEKVGDIYPPVVLKLNNNGKYETIDGFHRLNALQILDYDTVEAWVGKEKTDKKTKKAEISDDRYDRRNFTDAFSNWNANPNNPQHGTSAAYYVARLLEESRYMQGKIILYRAIRLANPEDFDPTETGESWTPNINFAEPYFGYNNYSKSIVIKNSKYETYILMALVPVESIDWKESVARALEFGPPSDEKEIVLKQGAPIELINLPMELSFAIDATPDALIRASESNDELFIGTHRADNIYIGDEYGGFVKSNPDAVNLPGVVNFHDEEEIISKLMPLDDYENMPHSEVNLIVSGLHYPTGGFSEEEIDQQHTSIISTIVSHEYIHKSIDKEVLAWAQENNMDKGSYYAAHEIMAYTDMALRQSYTMADFKSNLYNLVGRHPILTDNPDLAERVLDALHSSRKGLKFRIPAEIKTVMQAFELAEFEILVVGGAVRDMVLGLTPKDYDLATNALPSEVNEVIAQIEGYRVVITPEAQMARGVLTTLVLPPSGEVIEITTFRAELGYEEGTRRPVAVPAKTFKEDSERRDFTMNALGWKLNGTILDYHGGIDALEWGHLVPVGDAEERIQEDPLRILRAIRFFSKYGLEIDEDLGSAIESNLSTLHTLSPERVRRELDKILKSEEGIYDLFEVGIIETLIPEYKGIYWGDQNGEDEHEAIKNIKTYNLIQLTSRPWEIEAVYALLFEQVVDKEEFNELYRRGPIQFSKDEANKIADLIELYPLFWDSDDPEDIISIVTSPYYDTLIDMATVADYEGELRSKFFEPYRERYKGKPVKGYALQVADAYGIKPGIALGKKLQEIQDAIIMGDIDDWDDGLNQLSAESFSAEERIAYGAVVLDSDSQELLLQKFKSQIPYDWKTYAHHMTVTLGKSVPIVEDIGESIVLTVTSLGISDNAIAVGVEGYSSRNKIPHITLATPQDGKPFNSNKITDWQSITPLLLTGTVENVMTSAAEDFKAESVSKYSEEFWGTSGSGVLIVAADTKRILLGLRSADVNEPHTWGNFGGAIGIDDNGNVEEALSPEDNAIKEMNEEIGYFGSLEMIPSFTYRGGSFTYYNFVGIVATESLIPLGNINWEVSELRWFTLDEVSALPNLHFGVSELMKQEEMVTFNSPGIADKEWAEMTPKELLVLISFPSDDDHTDAWENFLPAGGPHLKLLNIADNEISQGLKLLRHMYEPSSPDFSKRVTETQKLYTEIYSKYFDFWYIPEVESGMTGGGYLELKQSIGDSYEPDYLEQEATKRGVPFNTSVPLEVARKYLPKSTVDWAEQNNRLPHIYAQAIIDTMINEHLTLPLFGTQKFGGIFYTPVLAAAPISAEVGTDASRNSQLIAGFHRDAYANLLGMSGPPTVFFKPKEEYL